MESNFKRGQSKVWWGSYPDDFYYDRYAAVERLNRNDEPKKGYNESDRRQGSQISFKSHDSGFSDHDLGNSTHNSSVNEEEDEDDSRPVTPPTVIRRCEIRKSFANEGTKGRRIQFDDEPQYLESPQNVKTSTPKKMSPIIQHGSYSETFESFEGSSMLLGLPNFENPLLNDNPDSIRNWLYETKSEYCHEVLCTLQSKPIIAEAMGQKRPNTSVAVNLIQYLKTQAEDLKYHFNEVEMNLSTTYTLDVSKLTDLAYQVQIFIININLKQKYFFLRSQTERNNFQMQIDSLLDTLTEFGLFIEAPEFNIEEVGDRLQTIKSFIIKILQNLYEKFVKIILKNLEIWEEECLICFSILNQITELLRADSAISDDCGFLSLNNAFLKTDLVKSLIIICINKSKYPRLQIQALRILAMICDNTEAIYQFEQEDGLHILKDLFLSKRNDPQGFKHNEPFIRESLSVLTQVTAPWHKLAHSLEGIKDNIESFTENITYFAKETTCCQTLLLTIASLNNLSKIEPTVVYSMMSNNTIFIIKKKIEARGDDTSIFIHEQFTSMLYNISKNRKSHHHLANKDLMNYLIQVFNKEFYQKYDSTASAAAHTTTIKNIIHVLTRVMDDVSVGREILLDTNISTIIRSFQSHRINDSQRSNRTMECSREGDYLNYSQSLQNTMSPKLHVNTSEVFL